VAWIALVPLLIALPGTRGLESIRLGYVTGAVSGVGLLYWTSIVVIQYGGLSLPVGLIVMFLLCLAVALFPAVFGWGVARLYRSFGARGLLLAPVAWVATEVLRAYTMFRFPWCLLGYSQYTLLPMAQLASITGVYGISFLVVLTSAVLAYAYAVRQNTGRILGGLAALLAAVWLHGTWTMSRPVAESGRIRAGLVQASILQDDKWDADKAVSNIERHVTLTRRAAAEGAKLIVWPESSVPFPIDLDRFAAVADQMRELARSTDAALVFGNDDIEITPDHRRIWVGAKMLDRDGRLVYRYHKNRLVPFGEYVPLQDVLSLGGRFALRLVSAVGEFTAGTEAAVGAVDGHTLGTSICYEAIFPDYVRHFSVNGAEMLLNVTNDGWYGKTSAPSQHFAMAVFRAIENRKWMLRAANTGITAFVDARGRIVSRTELFQERALVGEASFVPGLTFYARYGDVFAWACFAAAGLAVVVTYRK
jgi:apolipoprotein N-acyltransferase